MKYWLLKSEPESYSIDDMKRDGTTTWDGVRNYQARNYMWKEMATGDLALFYHSNAEPSGAVGVVEVAGPAGPDESAWNHKSPYFDPDSKRENPRWYCVPVKFKSKLKRIVTLDEIKKNKTLASMVLVRPGTRLSVQPVTEAEFKTILKMSEA
ncbi:MAG TPA: EVE domain-containing protein [Bdellovibrionales bacterium]|nr:EVE domain-containing protein [Bdellovibrionales bacterium]